MPRLAAALAVIASLLVAPVAQAGFAPGNDEIVTGANLFASAMEMDAQGNALIAWEQQIGDLPSDPYEVGARRITAGGAAGPLLNLDPGRDARDPVLAMTPSGRAFVAWRAPELGKSTSPTGVRGRWVEPDGSMGPVQTFVVGDEGNIQASGLLVAVDPAGVATVAWKNEIGGGTGGRVMLRRVQPDGALGPLVPDVFGVSPTDISMEALPDGSMLFVWRNNFIQKVVLGPNLEVGTPQNLSATNTAGEPELAVDSQGNGLATWRGSESEDNFSLRGQVLDPSGNLVGGELTFEPSFPEILDNALVVSDSLDDFLVSWWKADADEDRLVYTRSYNRLTGVMGPTQIASDPDRNAVTPEAAIDDFGTGAIVWEEILGMTGSIPYGRTINSLGTPIGPIAELFAPRAGLQRSASAPAAGVAAFVLDTNFDENGNRSILVRRHLIPPSCANSTATVVEGRPIDAALACAGPAIEGANVVTPPAHGSVGAFKAGPSLEYTPTPGFEGTDTFSYVAVNDGGASNVARVEITVRKDSVKPTIERFQFMQLKGAAKKKAQASVVRRPGFFVLRISEPASATVAVERLVRGVRSGKRCGKAKKRATGKRCLRRVKVGRSDSGVTGTVLRVDLSAKLAKRMAKGGRFRATAVATDLAGNRSKPKTISLRTRSTKRKAGR